MEYDQHRNVTIFLISWILHDWPVPQEQPSPAPPWLHCGSSCVCVRSSAPKYLIIDWFSTSVIFNTTLEYLQLEGNEHLWRVGVRVHLLHSLAFGGLVLPLEGLCGSRPPPPPGLAEGTASSPLVPVSWDHISISWKLAWIVFPEKPFKTKSKEVFFHIGNYFLSKILHFVHFWSIFVHMRMMLFTLASPGSAAPRCSGRCPQESRHSALPSSRTETNNAMVFHVKFTCKQTFQTSQIRRCSDSVFNSWFEKL